MEAAIAASWARCSRADRPTNREDEDMGKSSEARQASARALARQQELAREAEVERQRARDDAAKAERLTREHDRASIWTRR
jgi:hypothetical protein